MYSLFLIPVIFSDEGILGLTDGQDELVTIKFRKLKGLTSHGLDKIVSPCLEHVDLRCCPHVSFEGTYVNNECRNVRKHTCGHLRPVKI